MHTLFALTIIDNVQGGATQQEVRSEQKNEEGKDKGKDEEKAEEEKKEEEIEEVSKIELLALISPNVTPNEQVAMTTLVSLPHTTPSVSPNKPRKANVLYTLSTNSKGDVKDIEEDIDLNEVIPIPKFDLDNLSLDKIQVMQCSLHRKPRQEQKR